MNTIEFLRQFRVFEYAIFDLVASFLGIYLLSPLLSKLFKKLKLDIPKLNWVFLTLPISIGTHFAVGTITPMTENFINLHDHYILKIIVIGMTILGLRGIRIVKKR
ncbi:MAG: hypothetical protein Q8P68_03710 [Candidatus Peregrinibacteria bacterium]|nr:hypothetical protein [Candidatus Peregrinibacteria bacterium]MDZ4244736.1 hypothetical protein [Candidatus Gracilibacteria bacterium]